MDWEEYLDFDLDDVREMAGEEAVEAIMELTESTIQPLLDALEFAESESEIEMAQSELDATRISFSEAQSITEEYELSHLTDYMGQAYKSDLEKIERYLELTGQGYSGGGGGSTESEEAKRKRLAAKRAREQARKRRG